MISTPALAPDATPLPGMTLLDVAGPQSALGMHGRAHLFWKALDLMTTDSGVALMPTAIFTDAPIKLDVFLVPGGSGRSSR